MLAVDDGSFVWVGLYEPEDALLDKLQEEFGLHDLASRTRCTRTSGRRSRPTAIRCSSRCTPRRLVEDKIRFGETHAFLGPRYLVTVRHGASLSYAPVRARVEREPELLALGPAYAPVRGARLRRRQLPADRRGFRDSLNALEKDIFAETFRRETIVKLYELKRELTQLRLAVAPMQDILAQLTRMHGALVPDEVRLYFRDVLDHAMRVNESTDTLREMLTAAMSVNLSLVTVNQGEVVKKLAGWAALLAAPTLIASWYGMNFEHMPELHGRHSYAILIGVVGGGRDRPVPLPEESALAVGRARGEARDARSWLGSAGARSPLFAAFCLATLALSRGESVGALWIVSAAVSVFFIGYRFHARYIAEKALGIDPTRATPAWRRNDGLDYVPTQKSVLFGHHFAAIAGAGPLVGPVLAAQMGYLPGLLWILFGVVLAGAVQDMMVLFLSVRRDGRSLGEMIRNELGAAAGVTAMIGILAIMVILLAVLGAGRGEGARATARGARSPSR